MEENQTVNPLKKLLHTDGYIFGTIIGTLLPLITFILLYVAYHYLIEPAGITLNRPEILRILAIAVNFIPVRYYLVRLKYDRTGQSVLVITVLMVFLHFYNRW